MGKKEVIKNKLRIKKGKKFSPETKIRVLEEIYVAVTQLYCPNGHNMVYNQNHLFDGLPGISIFVRGDKGEGETILSPFHGDHSKVGFLDVKEGTICELLCPICKTSLPKIASCICQEDASIIGLFLTPELTESKMVGICNVWGCYRSRVIDDFEIISEFVQGHIYK